MQLQDNYNKFQHQLQIPMDISYMIPKDDPVFTFLEVINQVDLSKYLRRGNKKGNPGHSLFTMFSIVVFAFMEHTYSLRDIEKACKTDIRFIYLANGITPSHTAIGTFINTYILPSYLPIFYEINKKLIEIDSIDTSKLLQDGTKYEANANKNTFVWKKAVLGYQAKLFVKITALLVMIGECFGINIITKDEYASDSLDMIINLLNYRIRKENIQFVHGKGKRKTKEQKFYELATEYRSKLIEYKSKLAICGNRNSYSKIDHDATMMHMKWDYYNNTNVFRAGYNFQIGVSDEYILHAGLFQNHADTPTFIPFMEAYYKWYGEYPEKSINDAGYGSYENYMYCEEKGIEPYIKYTMYNSKKSVKFKKKIYNKLNWETNEEGFKVCPEGNIFDEILQVKDATKNENYPKYDVVFGCQGCEKCPSKKKCTKAERRTITENSLLNKFHDKVDENLATDKGIALRILRSIETEGAFGILKNNWKYDRIRRKSIERVEMELILTCIGFNLMKYHRKKQRNGEVIN